MENQTVSNNLYSDCLNRVILRITHFLAKKSDSDFVSKQQTELFCLVKGCCRIEFENNSVDMVEGDIFIISGNRKNKIVSVNPIECYSVYFNYRDYINEDLLVFKKNDITNFINILENCTENINHINVISKKIADLIFEIEKELDTRNVCTEYVTKSHIITILSYGMKYYCSDGFSNKISVAEHKKEIENILNYISENLSKDFTLSELANQVHLNKTYLSTIFKKTIGITIWEYILNARIELAISYLLENKGEYNITEISLRCGFNNSAYFNKTFKRITGKTPSEFKKSDYNICLQ